MERTEIEEAAEKLGLERNTVSKYIVRAGVLAFFVFLCLVIILTFLGYHGDFDNYPHVRVSRLPKNRFLAKIILIAEETHIEYGVFSRSQLLS